MALVTHDYKILYHDVGCQGRISDGGVWANSKFYEKLQSGLLNLPPARPLPKPVDPVWEPIWDVKNVPFVIVCDNAFPLTKHTMKPFPDKGLDDRKRIFNYRLSRFRRVSENAFGIWTNRFRIFRTTIQLPPDVVAVLVQASIALHNMLCTKSRESYNPPGFADEISPEGDVVLGKWREEPDELIPLQSQRAGNNTKKNAEKVREYLADFFIGPGQVGWQWKSLI